MLNVIIGGKELLGVSTQHRYFCYVFGFDLPRHISMRTAAACLERESEYEQEDLLPPKHIFKS